MREPLYKYAHRQAEAAAHTTSEEGVKTSAQHKLCHACLTAKNGPGGNKNHPKSQKSGKSKTHKHETSDEPGAGVTDDTTFHIIREYERYEQKNWDRDFKRDVIVPLRKQKLIYRCGYLDPTVKMDYPRHRGLYPTRAPPYHRASTTVIIPELRSHPHSLQLCLEILQEKRAPVTQSWLREQELFFLHDLTDNQAEMLISWSMSGDKVVNYWLRNQMSDFFDLIGRTYSMNPILGALEEANFSFCVPDGEDEPERFNSAFGSFRPRAVYEYAFRETAEEQGISMPPREEEFLQEFTVRQTALTMRNIIADFTEMFQAAPRTTRQLTLYRGERSHKGFNGMYEDDTESIRSFSLDPSVAIAFAMGGRGESPVLYSVTFPPGVPMVLMQGASLFSSHIENQSEVLVPPVFRLDIAKANTDEKKSMGVHETEDAYGETTYAVVNLRFIRIRAEIVDNEWTRVIMPTFRKTEPEPVESDHESD